MVEQDLNKAGKQNDTALRDRLVILGQFASCVNKNSRPFDIEYRHEATD